jgi:ABC-type transport system involved in multi-copper enzyme maturation permease subunit
MGNLVIWLTPVWVLSVGVTLGVALLLVLLGILWLISRRAAQAVVRLFNASVLKWIGYVAAGFVVFCFLAAPAMPVRQLFSSLRRLPQVGEQEVTMAIPAGKVDVEVPVNFLSDELQSYTFRSRSEEDEDSSPDLVVGIEPGKAFSRPLITVEGGKNGYVWTPSSKFQRLFDGPVTTLYVTNKSDLPTNFVAHFVTDVPLREVHQIPIAAASVAAVCLVFVLMHWLLPRMSAIALATSKEMVAQPIFTLALVIGWVLIGIYIYIPYNTFGEDVKMFKDSCLMTIMALSIFVSVWTASVSVSEEIEGRTALTLLSKPISRWQFVLGKFFGITWANLVLYVVLGTWMLILVSYKVVYDARETSNPEPSWQACAAEMVNIVPGLVLSYMESIVLTAISVAVSTRLPMLPNLVICGSIYVLGHLGPLIVQSAVGRNEFVSFFGQLIALILPVLDHFNVQAAVAGGVRVPWDYLLWAALYCALYSAVAMLFALILFEDRDLA